jgi:2'-5' RNA ligase
VIRAFVGVRLDSEVEKRIAAAQAAVRPCIPGVRWVEEANYHFTLKFLGAVSENRIPDIVNALTEALAPFAPFVVSARGVGVFPDIRKPRVIWVGLDSTELAGLARAVESALERIGFAREARSFQAHLTLGRWRDPIKPGEELRREIERRKDEAFGDSFVKKVILFQSTLKPGGAVYSEVEIFHLEKRRAEDC